MKTHNLIARCHLRNLRGGSLVANLMLAPDDTCQGRGCNPAAAQEDILYFTQVHYWNPTSPSISIVSDVAALASPLRKSVDSNLVLQYRSM
jgi:hypothetical protein